MDVDHVQKYVDRVAEVRGVPPTSLDGYKNMMIENLVVSPNAKKIENWAQRQTYIAMGFLLETAALLKIDACPMEGFDPAAYDKILNLEGTGWKSIASVALGYRHAGDGFQSAKKVRFTDDQLISRIR
jgi:nitroreductase